LFQVQYPAPGDPKLARRVQKLLAPLEVTLDNSWGARSWDMVGAPARLSRC
jgi:aromatic ring-opening dioxygenase catalytic subunit (LigB family)